MELALSTQDMAEISHHCEGTYPREACGILLGRVEEGCKVIIVVRPTDNAGQEGTQHKRYTIPPEQLLQGELEAERHELEVIGYYHSHPDHPARPSECDHELAWPGYSYLILSVQGGKSVEKRSWQLREDRSGFDEETVAPCKRESQNSW